MGLDLTCDQRAATVSGDGEWRRRRWPATELLERGWGRRLRSKRKSQISIDFPPLLPVLGSEENLFFASL